MSSNTAEFAVPQVPGREPTWWPRQRARSSERPLRPVKPDLLAEARSRVLEHVRRQGESSLGDLPRAWPITRRMMRLAAQQLAEYGRLQPVRNPESGQVIGYRAEGE